MAGTGHPYEVVNLDKVRDTLDGFAADVPHPEGKAWFGYPHVLRFATGPSFVVTVRGEEAAEAVALHVRDETQRAPLLAKLAAGADLRLFAPRFFENLGPDMRHLVDWMRALPEESPRTLRKLGRMTVPAVVDAADRWTAAMVRRAARETTGAGRAEFAVAGREGRVWWRLLDGDALEAESVAMDHCVRGRATALHHGTAIYSLRTPEGGSLVTVETMEGYERPAPQAHVGQIRARSNFWPDASLRRDVALLLEHVGAVRDVYREAAAVGLARDGSGRWKNMSDMADRIELGGLHCWAFGGDVHALSPADPDTVLAVASGPAGWWRAPPLRTVVLTSAGDRRTPLAAQRAVARFAMAIPGCQPGGMPWLVRKGDAWLPWADACEVVELENGARVLHLDGVHYVTRASDASDVLVTVTRPVGDDGKPSKRLVATPPARREWTAEEVRTIAAALDGLRADELEREDLGLRKAGLSSPDPGRWARFQDHATEHPYLGPVPDGRAPCWLSAPWRTVLRLPGGRDGLEIHGGADGAVRQVIDHWSDVAQIRDAARVLNELGRTASRCFLANGIGGMRWRCLDTVAKPEGPRIALGYGDGRWFVAETLEEVLAHLRSAGRRQFADPDCGEIAFRLLPPVGTDADCDLLLARHLAAWSRRTKADDLGWWRRNLWDRNDIPRLTTTERFQDAARLQHLMTPADRRAVGRLAAHYLRKVRSPRRNGGFDIMIEAEVRELVLALRDVLPDTALEFAVPRLLRFGDLLMARRSDATGAKPRRRPDLRWLEMLNARGDACPRMRAAIGEAASNTVWRVDAGGEDGQPVDPVEMRDWIRTGHAALSRWTRIGLMKGIERLEADVARLLALGHPEAPELAGEIAALRLAADPPKAARPEWPPAPALAA